MHDFNNSIGTSSRVHQECEINRPIRSYREIALVLTQRDGVPISPMQVRRTCLRAERKLARALLTDPSIHGRPLRSISIQCTARSLRG